MQLVPIKIVKKTTKDKIAKNNQRITIGYSIKLTVYHIIC